MNDTGVGIREEDLPKLVQPLFTTKSKGQGFGLSVCKRIIDTHKGEIIVKSKVSKGSHIHSENTDIEVALILTHFTITFVC